MTGDMVSIVMPTYNCGRFIARSIQSILAQSYINWELLVVDDCSTDDTRQVVEGFRDPRIRYFCNEHNSGAAISRNRALREAKGRWVAFLDSDDLWQPTKLENQLAFMKEHGYAFSYHEYIEIDEEDRELGIRVTGKRHVRKFDMYSCCWPGCLSVMYDASVIGLIQIEDIKKNNDSALWLRAIRKADCHLLPEVLGSYRRRNGSITPPGIGERVRWIYRLFREAEYLPVVTSLWWTGCNLVGQIIKKTFYIKKYQVQ